MLPAQAFDFFDLCFVDSFACHEFDVDGEYESSMSISLELFFDVLLCARELLAEFVAHIHGVGVVLDDLRFAEADDALDVVSPVSFHLFVLAVYAE